MKVGHFARNTCSRPSSSARCRVQSVTEAFAALPSVERDVLRLFGNGPLSLVYLKRFGWRPRTRRRAPPNFNCSRRKRYADLLSHVYRPPKKKGTTPSPWELICSVVSLLIAFASTDSGLQRPVTERWGGGGQDPHSYPQ